MPSKEETNWGVGLHLSVFGGYIVPLAGLVAPVVIWMAKKEQSPFLDAEGKKVINFLISLLIAIAISWALCLILIGFLLLVVVGLYGLILPIVNAVKLADGKDTSYPYTIQFLK